MNKNKEQRGRGVQGFNINRKNNFRYCGNNHPGCRNHKFDPINDRYIYIPMEITSKSKAKCGHFGCRNKNHHSKRKKYNSNAMKKKIQGKDKRELLSLRNKYVKKYYKKKKTM